MQTTFSPAAQRTARIHLPILWAVILISVASVSWTDTSAAQELDFDGVVEAEFVLGEVPGLAVAVLKDGQVIYDKGVGLADVKAKTPITTSTQFMIGSVTKQFTAMAVMILVEQGDIVLDMPVNAYLPLLPITYTSVTVRHLLTHSSGIQSDFKRRSQKPFFNESLIDDPLYEALESTRLEFPPGDGMSYSNTGYSLLYMVIEAVSGSSYNTFLTDHIFAPLGMTSTESRDLENQEIDGLAIGYGLSKKKFRRVSPVLRLGGGSLVSTIDDLAKWDAALRTEQLVRSETLEQIWTPHPLSNGEPANMGKDPQGRFYQAGFGWFIGHESGKALVHHSGGVDGYASNIDRYREEGLTVIALCNIENGTPMALTHKLAEHYFENQ